MTLRIHAAQENSAWSPRRSRSATGAGSSFSATATGETTVPQTISPQNHTLFLYLLDYLSEKGYTYIELGTETSFGRTTVSST